MVDTTEGDDTVVITGGYESVHDSWLVTIKTEIRWGATVIRQLWLQRYGCCSATMGFK